MTINPYECHQKLSQPTKSIKGIGVKIAGLLEKKGIYNIEDLLYFIPRAYEDRRAVRSIAELASGSRVTLVAEVRQVRLIGRRILEVLLDDGTGQVAAKWFQGNENYLRRIFKVGTKVIVSGLISSYHPLKKEIIHPDFELFEDGKDSPHFNRIVPIYSETEHLSNKTIRRIIHENLENYAPYLLSPIPPEILKRRKLIGINEAIRSIHFPPDHEELSRLNRFTSPAHRRLIYDEFFFFQLGLAMKRKDLERRPGLKFPAAGRLTEAFLKHLPFSLTSAQKRVAAEIYQDLEGGRAMNRLIQGDVGSGKTVVCVLAMLAVCQSNYQSVLMVPTEILAEQHFRQIKLWMEPLGVHTVILTGSIKGKERKHCLEEIKSGRAQMIIGTHALIEGSVTFSRLGLVVIDEQHRFGVIQRSALRHKGDNPHLLVMTATPIPRTLALTFYGDLDISVIEEMPPGKKPVYTRVFMEQERKKVYDLLRKEMSKGHQGFVVYPLAEESELSGLKDATAMASRLQREVFPDFRIGLIHGRMRREEKVRIMSDFKEKKLDLLVATTVIEVGIDVPVASVMVIEHAERFGLSQLHQLRGRVGRGAARAFCALLVGRDVSPEAGKRLKKMEETASGFQIAEEDLALRGPGEFMGTRQSGLPDFRFADIIRDAKLLDEARADAFQLIADDPLLEKEGHILLKEVLLLRWKGKLKSAGNAD